MKLGNLVMLIFGALLCALPASAENKVVHVYFRDIQSMTEKPFSVLGAPPVEKISAFLASKSITPDFRTSPDLLKRGDYVIVLDDEESNIAYAVRYEDPKSNLKGTHDKWSIRINAYIGRVQASGGAHLKKIKSTTGSRDVLRGTYFLYNSRGTLIGHTTFPESPMEIRNKIVEAYLGALSDVAPDASFLP